MMHMVPKPFSAPVETTTEAVPDDPDVTEYVTEIVSEVVQEVIHVTPRSRMAKSRLLPMVKETRAEKQLKAHRSGVPDTTRGLKFIIANQQDVTDVITITNDGTLMTAKPLDREERDVYRLTVIAEYFQGFVSGAGIYQVIIYVDDVNDNAPKFNLHAYSGNFKENSPVNTEVVLDQAIVVTDADIGENAEFTVMLFGDGSHLFAIDKFNKTNGFHASQPLDRNHRLSRALASSNIAKRRFANVTNNVRDSPNENGKTEYMIKFIGPNIIDRELQSFFELTLQAKDKGGLFSEVKLTIYVQDVNDNAPMFEKIAVFKNMGIEILEYTNDLEIYFIERQAPDALTYPIRHHMMDNERLVPSASNYEIMQFAESSNIGTPRLIRDSNQTSLGSKSRYRRRNNERPYPLFSILENVEVGSNILKLTAVDEDYEENAQVAYGIVSETFISPKSAPKRINTSKFFGIDVITGELRVHRPLSAQSEILLNISAVDAGGLKDFTTIKFKV